MATSTLDTTLPRTGSISDPVAQGRLAALRTFTAAMTTLDGLRAYEQTIDTVVNGHAPQDFKDAFVNTLVDLRAIFDTNAQ